MVSFVNSFSQFCIELQEKYIDCCNSILACITNENIETIESTKKLYGILEKDTFNMFEPLEDYQKELFNEIVLTQILDPKTREIGNIAFLHIFSKILSEKTNYRFNNDVVVENQVGNNEYGFIDILISDKQNAIIIESKTNGAPDQPNQLVRYLLYVENILKKKF